MIIEKAEKMPTKSKGRPVEYPFNNLEPGLKLTIECLKDHQVKRKSVSSAINYYKRSNKLTWNTAVRVEGNNIVVYRLN